ncbi:MAG: hypothetical protein ACNI3C_03475 [Candidatus Marinarcus sp.]|uniref:hypothetical protein n=1 Tax=Candidatus Marinarcus sp. TaxID=3100987 RepID=UPI003B0085B2
MFKLFFAILILTVSLNATVLQDKIENLMGSSAYKFHKNLLNIIFKDESKFLLANNNLNYLQILKELKQNGLLILKLQDPKEIIVEFQTNKDPIKALKILNDTLKSIGYYYYFTNSVNYDGEGNLNWQIRLKTEFIIDPFVLTNELLKKECKILDINREKNDKWVYKIDTNFANITESIFIDTNEIVKLQKPLKPYFIRINDAKVLKIMSTVLNHWYPYVVFYDEHLDVLKIIKKDAVFKRVSITIPEKTKYIKITDLYTLVNIKRGLSVIIKE